MQTKLLGRTVEVDEHESYEPKFQGEIVGVGERDMILLLSDGTIELIEMNKAKIKLLPI